MLMMKTKHAITYHQNVSSPTYRHPQVHNPLIPNNPCDQLKNFHNSSGPLVGKIRCVLGLYSVQDKKYYHFGFANLLLSNEMSSQLRTAPKYMYEAVSVPSQG